VAKLLLVAGVVVWMAHKGAIDPEVLRRAAGNWPMLLAALGVMLVTPLLTALRWRVLLRIHNIELSLFDLLRLVMVGLFFTLIAPGGIGGDVVKAWYVARDSSKRAAAATSVLLDRYLGLVTLLLLGIAMIALQFRTLWHAEVEGLRGIGLPLNGGQTLILSLGAVTVGLVVLALLVMNKRLRNSRLAARASRLVPFRRTIRHVYEAAHACGDHPGLLIRSAFWSVIAQSLMFISYYFIGLAVGAKVTLGQCILIIPPAMLIRFLPLVPGGAGQGMVGMALLFPLVGVADGAEIGALGDVIFVILYLVGGLFFLFGKNRHSEIREVVDG
jgi:glycosyltransferase 2 family protein